MGLLASFRLKHVNLSARTVFQDGREVKTKRRKTFTSHFFPVGPKPLNIVSEYVAMLTTGSLSKEREGGFSDKCQLQGR